MKKALNQFEIRGISSTIPFYQFMLEHPAFVQGERFIEKYGIEKPEIEIRTMKARWGSCIVREL